MRLMTLCLISLLLLSCNNAPDFPRDEVQALNKQDMKISVYMMPKDIDEPVPHIRDEPLEMSRIKDVCISFDYYMRLRDFGKNAKIWSQQHCK